MTNGAFYPSGLLRRSLSVFFCIIRSFHHPAPWQSFCQGLFYPPKNRFPAEISQTSIEHSPKMVTLLGKVNPDRLNSPAGRFLEVRIVTNWAASFANKSTFPYDQGIVLLLFSRSAHSFRVRWRESLWRCSTRFPEFPW